MHTHIHTDWRFLHFNCNYPSKWCPNRPLYTSTYAVRWYALHCKWKILNYVVLPRSEFLVFFPQLVYATPFGQSYSESLRIIRTYPKITVFACRMQTEMERSQCRCRMWGKKTSAQNMAILISISVPFFQRTMKKTQLADLCNANSPENFVWTFLGRRQTRVPRSDSKSKKVFEITSNHVSDRFHVFWNSLGHRNTPMRIRFS